MFCVQNKGLSSKQVSGGEALDWVQNLMQGGAVLELPKNYQVQQQHEQQQQKQQQLDPLKCPRCESTNTKFCYYNNYNRSQPRHFCKSCRRHWTKGGTLRNVPVGGGRKSKRPKTSTCSSSNSSTTATTASMISSSTTTITANDNCHMINRGSSVQQNLPFALGHDQKSVPQILYKALLQPTSIKPDYTYGNDDELSSSNMIGGWPPLSLDNLLPPATVSTLNSSSCTSSMPSFSGCFESIITQNYTNQRGLPEYPSMLPMPWPSLPITSNFDSSSCWNWEDLNSFLSITDQKQPWDVPN